MAGGYFIQKDKNGQNSIPLYVISNGRKYGPIEIPVDASGIQLRKKLGKAGYILNLSTVKLYYNTGGTQKEISSYEYRTIKELGITPNSVIYTQKKEPRNKVATSKIVFVNVD